MLRVVQVSVSSNMGRCGDILVSTRGLDIPARGRVPKYCDSLIRCGEFGGRRLWVIGNVEQFCPMFSLYL